MNPTLGTDGSVEAHTVVGMPTEAFLAWLAKGHGGEYRWELVDCAPRRIEPRGARCGTVIGNVHGLLRQSLRDRPCHVLMSGLYVEPRPNVLRLPDILVECGASAMDDPIACDPRVVVAVNPSGRPRWDSYEMLEDYWLVPSISHVVQIDAWRPNIALLTRGEGGWHPNRYDDLEATLRLSAIDADLPLAEIYEDVTFE